MPFLYFPIILYYDRSSLQKAYKKICHGYFLVGDGLSSYNEWIRVTVFYALDSFTNAEMVISWMVEEIGVARENHWHSTNQSDILSQTMIYQYPESDLNLVAERFFIFLINCIFTI